MRLTCEYFDAGLCRSCTELATPYESQLRRKDEAARALLAHQVPAHAWREPFASPISGFRNKAKLAIGGTTAHPTLGLTSRNGHGIDLRECKIQAPEIWDVIPDLAGFITYAGLEPYDVYRRRGELKFILITVNSVGELMVRFVLRSDRQLTPLREALPALQARLPQIRVISANFLPEHKAVTEGAEEIALTAQESLPMQIGDVTLYLRHKSFFQTNTAVASGLYAQARDWADDLEPRTVLDLYCGVGGFALHVDREGRKTTGLEIEPDAVLSAKCSADEMGVADRVTFDVQDMTGSHLDRVSDLIIVNPPRRGIGDLALALDQSDCHAVIYSSCNPASLARDLEFMPSFEARSARLFDMFPHTKHSEVAVLLQRKSS